MQCGNVLFIVVTFTVSFKVLCQCHISFEMRSGFVLAYRKRRDVITFLFSFIGVCLGIVDGQCYAGSACIKNIAYIHCQLVTDTSEKNKAIIL